MTATEGRSRVLTVKLTQAEYERLRRGAMAHARRGARGDVMHVALSKFVREAALAAAERAMR